MPKQTTLEPEMGVSGLDDLTITIERGGRSSPDKVIVTDKRSNDPPLELTPFSVGDNIRAVYPVTGGVVGLVNESGVVISVQNSTESSIIPGEPDHNNINYVCYHLPEGIEVERGIFKHY